MAGYKAVVASVVKGGKTKLAIKMRTNTDMDAKCSECGCAVKDAIMMFDLCIAGKIVTLCDQCNSMLFSKTLSADCKKNAKLKTKEDIAIAHKRAAKRMKERKHD